jgi:hypothetical protein
MSLRMNKKLILPIALLSFTSASIFASTSTFQASIASFVEPTITEVTGLNFGKILPTAGSTCTMSSAGVVSGNCDASNTSISLGAITLSSMAKNAAINVTITGGASSGGELSFDATATATGGVAPVTTVDGTPAALTANSAGSDIAINVYGTMTVVSALTSGTAYTVDYTVDVQFQ